MGTKVLSKLGIHSDNDRILASLSFVLFMPLLFDFITSLSSGPTSNITMIIYGASFIVFIAANRTRILLRNFLPLLLIYFICLLNILFFPESKLYFGTTQFLILLYFLPIGFILFRTISSWDNFIPILFIIAPFAILVGLYVLLFTRLSSSEEDLVSYMEFSYALLPFVSASYAFYINKNSLVGLFLFIIGIIEMLSFGCRGAVISAIIFAVLHTIFNSKRNKAGFILFFVIIAVVALNIEIIINALSGLSLFENSYILKRVLDDSVFEISTREIILENCERRLSSMGMEISGLFGDRPYCGAVYPHNIVYEVFMQWGWILGALVLLYFALLFVKGFFRDTTARFVTLFFFCTVFLRFFISGSYLNSGLFWIMIACMQSLKNHKSNATKRIIR